MARTTNQNENPESACDAPQIELRREGDCVVVRVPVKFYRRKGRQMILSDASAESATEPRPNRTLVENLAKAYRWQEQLESGEYSSFYELGKAVGVDRTYISRILQLNSLAPSLVERILNGDEPSGLSMESLRKSIPEIWSRQSWA